MPKPPDGGAPSVAGRARVNVWGFTKTLISVLKSCPHPLEGETPFVVGGSALGTFLFTLLSILRSTCMYIADHMKFLVRPG